MAALLTALNDHASSLNIEQKKQYNVPFDTHPPKPSNMHGGDRAANVYDTASVHPAAAVADHQQYNNVDNDNTDDTTPSKLKSLASSTVDGASNVANQTTGAAVAVASSVTGTAAAIADKVKAGFYGQTATDMNDPSAIQQTESPPQPSAAFASDAETVTYTVPIHYQAERTQHAEQPSSQLNDNQQANDSQQPRGNEQEQKRAKHDSNDEEPPQEQTETNGSSSPAPQSDNDDHQPSRKTTSAAAAGAGAGAAAGAATNGHGKVSNSQLNDHFERQASNDGKNKRTEASDVKLNDDTSAADLAKHGKQYLEQIDKLFVQDDMIESSRLFQTMHKLVDKFIKAGEHKSDMEQLKQQMDDKKYEYIRKLPTEIEQIKKFFTADEDGGAAQGFKKVADKSGVQTYYRKNDGGETHTFLVSGTIEGNITQVLAIIYEIQNMQDWIPLVQLSRKLLFPESIFRMLVNIQIMKIWPVACREVLLYGYGDVDKENVLIFFRSVDRERESFKEVVNPLPPIAPSHVEATLYIGGMQITPLDATHTRLKFISHVDPKLKLIPNWLLNYATEKLCYLFISVIRSRIVKMEKAKKKGTSDEILDAVKKQPHVYKEINRRVAQNFPGIGSWLDDVVK